MENRHGARYEKTAGHWSLSSMHSMPSASWGMNEVRSTGVGLRFSCEWERHSRF